MRLQDRSEVVISGIGAKLPESSNIEEFAKKLFSKSVLFKNDLFRHTPDNVEKPYKTGKIPGSDRFDYSFFGISTKLVDNCDPEMTQVMERSYEAIMDSGINPLTLRGRNVCVVVASALSDAETVQFISVDVQGYGMMGLSRTMLANRISYFFNFTGPSYTINCLWVSAVQALDIAANLLSQGLCEAAIVTSSNVINYNNVEKEYIDLNFLAPDRKCLPFDSNASGFVRSEATVAFFLQRAQDAKRHYCTILNSKVECLNGEDTSFIQINPNLEHFYKDFYTHCKVNPLDVSYIEAFGFCNKEYDALELNTVSNIFYNGKFSTLVGSVSGNVGNTGTQSGFVSLVKAIIAMETGVIPPTVGYTTPNPKVPSLVSGQLKPVTESTTLPGNLIAVNCLNLFGHVGHILVKRHNKSKKTLSLGELPPDGMPRLVVLQTRHEEGAIDLIDKLSKMPVDTEYIALINEVFKTSVPNYLWRSYITVPIINDKKNQAEIEKRSAEQRKLCFVFSGMGSQWPGMGKDLLQIPLFAASVDRCDRVLAPHGINIRHILTTDNPETFDNILNCFVGIAVIQVGLVDILNAVGVSPDIIIGHSVGELGCAYADGCLTAEEMVLAAYYRGKASLESENIKGMMAAVGVGYNDMKNQLPPTIDVACHNSATSCTLSGPTNDVLKYVDELKSKNVFAKAVSAGGIAYHSRYIKEIGGKLLTYLRQVIKDPKPRSPRWISTSVPQTQWDTPEAQLCSAEYHTNNLLSSVLFEEGCQHLPKNVILLEIAPHGLLQSILRHGSGIDSISLTLTNKANQINNIHLLGVLGKLHNQGVNLDVNALYPLIQYPVARGTPSLVDFATWNHSERFFHSLNQIFQVTMKRSEKVIDINHKNPNYKLWREHCICGSIVVPTSQLLWYVWVAMSKRLEVHRPCIIFEEVIISENMCDRGSDYFLMITLTPSSFKFEISSVSNTNLESNIIFRGQISDADKLLFSIQTPLKVDDVNETVEGTEIYSVLASYGCQLGGQFQLIKQITVGKKACVAQVQWTGNLVTFLDAFFKVAVFIHSEKELTLMQPSSFTRLTINQSFLQNCTPNSLIDVYYDLRSKRLVCEAVELCGITLSPTPSEKPPPVCWREVKVQAHESIKFSIEEFLSTIVQVASQTGLSPWAKKASHLNIIIMKDGNETLVLFLNILNEVLKSLPNISVKLKELDFKGTQEYLNDIKSQGCLLIGHYNKAISILETATDSNIYCLVYSSNNESPRHNMQTQCITSYQYKGGQLSLLKKKSFSIPLQHEKVFEVHDYACLEILDKKMTQDKSRDQVLVISSKLTPRYLLPILANKPYAHRICTIFILDKNAPRFSINSPVYKNGLGAGITVGLPLNILSDGVWGTLITSSINLRPQYKNFDRLLYSSNNSFKVICTGVNLNYFTPNQEQDINKRDLSCVDFSGYMGDQQVMGVAKYDSTFSLSPDPVLRWPLPTNWTLEEAASVPAIYTLAYYCVHVKGCVKAGEDVLVHAGMSLIGQAVIGITLQIGANVFTSVTDEKEAAELLKMHPLLKPANVILLDNTSVFLAISKLTAGRGVQVIVNCSRGNDMRYCVKTMGFDCRFLHLGQIKIEDNESIGMLVFLKRTSFFGISLENILTCSHSTKVNLHNALQKGLNEGLVKPLRMATFSCKEEEYALKHLSNKHMCEKTILINDKKNKLYPKRLEEFTFTKDQSVVILGTKSDFWMDVAEWMVFQGARTLVIFVEEEDELQIISSSRFSRIVNRFNTKICLLSTLQLLPQENALKVLKEMLVTGEINYIFCIQQDESSAAMRNLDLASRELVPNLRQFVSLLGKGAAVSESRAESGLPVCCVQSTSSLQNPAHVLPYLSTLPANSSSNSRFFFVSDNVKSFKVEDYMDFQEFLPATVDELCQMGDSVSETPVFREEVTRSPGHQHLRHSLLPVFVISGLGSQSMQPLLRQLIHPAFCCTLPAFITSVVTYAELLLEGVLKIQKQGTFNLVGSSWGGPVVLVLANLLEARGHHVRLFLLEGAPIFIQNRIRGLCNKYNSDLGPSLLGEMLKLTPEGLKRVSQLNSWEGQLEESLEEGKIVAGMKQSIAKAATCLYSQLGSMMHQERHIQIHGNLTLITYKPVSQTQKEILAQLTDNKDPNTVTVENESYIDFLTNPKTASVINKHLAFQWIH